MKLEIYKFLNEISNNNPNLYLKFYEFYIKPSISLGRANSYDANYYKHGNIKYFILNESFFEFLSLCMQDHTFNSKCDYNSLKKIENIIIDTLLIINNYTVSKPRSITKFLSKKKSEWVLKFNYLIENADIDVSSIYSIDVKLLNQLLTINRHMSKIFKENHILNIGFDRKNFLNQIKEDDYDFNMRDTLLYNIRNNAKIMYSLVCSNEFMNIVETKLIGKYLDTKIVNNIIIILETSIYIKTLRYDKIDDLDFKYDLIGKELIKEFDLNKANSLLDILYNKLDHNSLTLIK